MLSDIHKFIPQSWHASIRAALVAALQVGPLPKHIAIVLDGNRRFARQEGKPVVDGHKAGREALKRVLEFILHLPIPHVTLYAFSIDNFNRVQEEIDGLMDLARVTLQDLCRNGKLFDKYGVKIKVIGKLSLLPEDVQKLAENVHEITKNNTRGTLNVCLSYTSTEEISTAVRTCVEQVQEKEYSSMDLTAEKIESNLYTATSPPVDILVRTSGVHRFSNFLLWQVNNNTSIEFLDTLWPSIGTMDLVPIIIDWQRHKIMDNMTNWWSSSSNEHVTTSTSSRLHVD